jgi:hypothetical protein
VAFYCLIIQLKIKVDILADEFQSIFAIGEWLNAALGNSHYHF